MNIGEIIAQKGIVIRGNTIIDSPKVIASILKTKIANHHREAQRVEVVHTTHVVKPAISGLMTPKNDSLFKDEMLRLGVVKERQDNRIHLGTKHMRTKQHITTHAGIKLDEFSFAEAMAVTSDKQLKKLGRIHGNFDDIEMRATNK